MTVAMDPGPAISGMASGKTEGSSLSSSSSASSACPCRRLVRRSNSMSRAVRNNRIPPAIRNAGMEMPTKPSTASPKAAKTIRISAAVMQARRAMARRRAVSIPCVRATKSGVMPTGSIMTNSVTKAVIRKVGSIASAPGLFQSFKGGHPKRFCAVEPVHDLGILLVPYGGLAGVLFFVHRRVGQLGGDAVAHLVEFFHPLLAFAHVLPQGEDGIARRAFGLGGGLVGSAGFGGVFPAKQHRAIAVQIALVGLHRAIPDQPQPVGHKAQQVHVVTDKDNRAGIGGQRLDQCLAAFDIEVVGLLVEY